MIEITGTAAVPNEHLKSARDSARADYYSNPKHRSEKAYKQFKHSVDYGKGIKNDMDLLKVGDSE
nr:MAG TPA: Flagellar assembly protein T, N-terminal domain [Caudoviricetes sp.]